MTTFSSPPSEAKRLDLARDAERAVDAVPGRIVAGWGG